MKTIAAFRQALDIFATYEEEGENASYIFEAEHGIIYSHLSAETVPEDSADGAILLELGWHTDTDIDMWAYYA